MNNSWRTYRSGVILWNALNISGLWKYLIEPQIDLLYLEYVLLVDPGQRWTLDVIQVGSTEYLLYSPCKFFTVSTSLLPHSFNLQDRESRNKEKSETVFQNLSLLYCVLRKFNLSRSVKRLSCKVLKQTGTGFRNNKTGQKSSENVRGPKGGEDKSGVHGDYRDLSRVWHTACVFPLCHTFTATSFVAPSLQTRHGTVSSKDFVVRDSTLSVGNNPHLSTTPTTVKNRLG